MLDRQGLHYVEGHLTRVPLVVAIRVLRGWGLFDPVQQARWTAAETCSPTWQEAAWPVTLLLLVLAIPGFVLLRKDRLALALTAGPAVVATLVLAVAYGKCSPPVTPPTKDRWPATA